jgi:hypothetical protein
MTFPQKGKFTGNLATFGPDPGPFVPSLQEISHVFGCRPKSGTGNIRELKGNLISAFSPTDPAPEGLGGPASAETIKLFSVACR